MLYQKITVVGWYIFSGAWLGFSGKNTFFHEIKHFDSLLKLVSKLSLMHGYMVIYKSCGEKYWCFCMGMRCWNGIGPRRGCTVLTLTQLTQLFKIFHITEEPSKMNIGAEQVFWITSTSLLPTIVPSVFYRARPSGCYARIYKSH